MELQSMKHLKIIPPEELPLEDGLQLMIRLQKELNQKIYPIVIANTLHCDLSTKEVDINQCSAETIEALTKEYLLAIIRECAEALDMINSKPWRKTRKKIDVLELKYEMIDIQHFVNSLYDIWQMDRNEVLGIFLAKYKENQRRHENGY